MLKNYIAILTCLSFVLTINNAISQSSDPSGPSSYSDTPLWYSWYSQYEDIDNYGIDSTTDDKTYAGALCKRHGSGDNYSDSVYTDVGTVANYSDYVNFNIYICPVFSDYQTNLPANYSYVWVQDNERWDGFRVECLLYSKAIDGSQDYSAIASEYSTSAQKLVFDQNVSHGGSDFYRYLYCKIPDKCSACKPSSLISYSVTENSDTWW